MESWALIKMFSTSEKLIKSKLKIENVFMSEEKSQSAVHFLSFIHTLLFLQQLFVDSHRSQC